MFPSNRIKFIHEAPSSRPHPHLSSCCCFSNWCGCDGIWGAHELNCIGHLSWHFTWPTLERFVVQHAACVQIHYCVLLPSCSHLHLLHHCCSHSLLSFLKYFFRMNLKVAPLPSWPATIVCDSCGTKSYKPSLLLWTGHYPFCCWFSERKERHWKTSSVRDLILDWTSGPAWRPNDGFDSLGNESRAPEAVQG